MLNGAYIKFPIVVDQKQVIANVPEPIPSHPAGQEVSPSVRFVPPYQPMHTAVKQVRLDQSSGLHEHNTAFTVEPIKGLHLLVHISSDTPAIDDTDVLNGLTEVLHYIHENYRG